MPARRQAIDPCTVSTGRRECSTRPAIRSYTGRVRTLRLLPTALLACLSSGCLVAALHPVYEPGTIAFDPALVGRWVSGEDAGRSLTFERGEWLSYHVEYRDERQRIRASARLTRVGRTLVLDVAPLDGTDLPALTIPVHLIYRLEIGDETIALAELDYESLAAQARSGEPAVAATIDGRGNVILTAGTRELRRWLDAAQDGEGPFADPVVYRRSAPEPAGY